MNTKKVLTFFFSLLFFNLVISQQNNYLFETLDVKDGLSQNTVNCIFQDSYGFMWFGTEYGLNKYDGFNFTKNINDPADSNSLGGLNVRDIFEDGSGDLWFSTGNSISTLSIENRDYGKFINYNIPTIWGIEGSKIFPNSIIWIASKNGLNIFNKKNALLKNISKQKKIHLFFELIFFIKLLKTAPVIYG